MDPELPSENQNAGVQPRESAVALTRNYISCNMYWGGLKALEGVDTDVGDVGGRGVEFVLGTCARDWKLRFRSKR